MPHITTIFTYFAKKTARNERFSLNYSYLCNVAENLPQT